MGMTDTFNIPISAFISNALHAAWRALASIGFGAPHGERGPSFTELMEESSATQLSVKQMKRRFAEALQADDAHKVMQILHTGKLDVDTVLEVEDPGMVLASYKQGTEAFPQNPH